MSGIKRITMVSGSDLSSRVNGVKFSDRPSWGRIVYFEEDYTGNFDTDTTIPVVAPENR